MLSRTLWILALVSTFGWSAPPATSGTDAGDSPRIVKCGILADWQDCDCMILRRSWGGDSYCIENHEGYADGDTVLVAGILVEDCSTLCPYADDCIVDNIIQPCTDFNFGGGTISWDGEWCTYFDSWEYGSFIYGPHGDHAPGDTIGIVGELERECYTWCTPSSGCINADSTWVFGDSVTSVVPITWGAIKSLYR